MKESIRKKLNSLKEEIRRHDHLYYNLDQPEIRDYEYDKLFKELVDLEHQYPELKTADSPSQKIPGKALEKFEKSAHSQAMLSLQNSYSKEEITAFYNRVLKLLGEDFSCFVEPKLDGMAVELVYRKGVLVKALTRGDGEVGENITENVKTLKGLPLSLGDIKNIPPLLELRGEILILKKDFEKINQEQEEKGQAVFANPRNLAAGSLRQLNPKVTASRPLYCFIHSPGLIRGYSIKTQKDFISAVQNWRLPSFHFSSSQKIKAPKLYCLAHSLDEILDYYDQMMNIRYELPFEIDGIVIKVNNFEQQKKLGVIARSPRWAMAGKFPPEEAVTQVKGIRLQVGRTGVVTPVALLKPLSLGGVLIRQASLHNFEDLGRKDIRIGDFVLVHRAGDVIPELIRPLKEKRLKGVKPFIRPKKCPVCQSLLEAQGDYLLCRNTECPAVKENKFIHFVGKRAMDIEFLGKKSLRKFYEWGWLNNYSDIYDLKDRPLKDKEGFGDKSYELLVRSLDKSKKTELSRLIFGLGIPLIGEQTAQKISERIYNIYGKNDLNIKKALSLIKNMKQEDLEDIEDIGPLAAKSFQQAFQNKNLLSDLQSLHDKGIRFLKKQELQESLKGLIFVITGTLPESRESVKKRIQLKGGRVASQISQKTDFLLIGKKPGSKQSKAQELGLKVINWNEFLEIIG